MKNYQIVFIPMINPDGVIHGNSRCNVAGLDLNRRWNEDCLKVKIFRFLGTNTLNISFEIVYFRSLFQLWNRIYG